MIEQPANVRYYAARTLAELGPRAKAATSALITAVSDQNHNIRSAARYALNKIDPEAAAKAGVRK